MENPKKDNTAVTTLAAAGLGLITGGYVGERLGKNLKFIDIISQKAKTAPKNVAGVLFATCGATVLGATVEISKIFTKEHNK